ncbi:MAG TPA: filamentous hemagglutinin N-terminal domain-containing protein [Alphaproteobacteria bacterium]|nr:filamentous hemagglutinin N-terminal domain-containing protein [Alphaproteobacteria bacterium]
MLATSCLAAVGTAMPVPLAAAPAGLSVGSGQVTVSNPNAQTTLIQQGTNKAVLNWNSFSVGSAETVRFQQPNSSSVALNRVTGSQASSIFGHLTANGQVFLLNPNGILFGRNSVVNVAGLVATTSGIRDSDFLAGNYNFGIASPNPNAGVVNQGTIQAADGGYAVLSGAYVQNDGLIQARLGKVVLAGTTTFAVDFAGDNLLSFAVTGPVTQVPTDANGNPVTSLVSNTGSIVADGGQVTLTARAAKGILDNVINTTGMIEASTASMVNGTIVLDAGDGGVTVGGGLSATGLNPGETGGTINVLGGAITIASGATINASGDAGGGSVFIGGNFHGAGPLPNAWTTNVQQGAVILADAVTYGNGGNVAVWADGYTAFNGTISAQGGALGGNGGFVETSGHQGLSIQAGSVNTLAPNGQVGTWLLDPMNITIVSSGGTASLTQVSSYLNDAGLSDTINASLINAAASNVTLQATNNITFNTTVGMTTTGVGITAQAGNDISVNFLLDTTGGNIKLSANDNIAGTATGHGSIQVAAGGANIETNLSGATGGSITLTTNGGTGSINTGSAPIQTANAAVSISAGSGTNSDVNTNNGVGITLGNGSGTITTTGSAGTVSLTSAGGISLNSGAGILTTGAGVTVSANDSSAGTPTGSGSITLTDIGISTTGKAGTTVSMTNGSNTLSILNLTGIAFSTGQTISGPGIPSGTTITGVTGSTLTLSNNVTVSASDVFVRAIGGSSSTGGAITLTTNGGSGAISLGTAGLLTAGGAITLNGASIASNTAAPGLSSAGNNASGASSGAGGNVSITTTTGGVTLGGGIITSGGFNSSNVGGNSGSVTISSAGAVDIGGGLSLITSGSGSALIASVQSIATNAASPSNTSQTTGNGGAISVTGTSIKLALGATSNGGTDEVTGSTSGGGNAGTIALNATSGDVVIGSDSTGSVTGLIARGGDSLNGSGGNGANISVTGTAISSGGKILSRGGDTVNGPSGGAGANITLTATGSDLGHSIRLYGTSDSPTDTDGTLIQADVSSRGGQTGQSGGEFTLTGTVRGAGGNIIFQGSGGGALQSDVLLQTSSASSLNGGSNVSIGAGGGSSGGAIRINGSINAASANVESLRLTAGNGSATIAGGVGASTALNSLTFGTGINDLPSGSNGGAITLQGPVTVSTLIQDFRNSGSLTFNGFLTTPQLRNPGNSGSSAASLAMLGGGLFTGDIKTGGSGSNQTISLAGNFTIASSFTGSLNGNDSPNFIIAGPGSFDSSAVNRNLVINSIFSNSPFTINSGSGNLTISSVSSNSGATLALRGSGFDQILATSGPVAYDLRNFSGTTQITGGTTLTKDPPKGAVAALIPPPPAPPVNFAPPPMPIFTAPVPIPVVAVTPAAPGPVGSAASENAPTTVQGTDTGGSMFSQISPATPGPGTGSSSGGTSGGEGQGSSTTGSPGTGGTAGPGGSTASSGGSSGGSPGAARGGTGGATGSTTGSTTSAPPPDSGDRAMSVIAQPPPVQPVSHPLPAPPRVTAPVIPGFVSQVQHPVVPKSGTPGVQQGFSASGNSGRW